MRFRDIPELPKAQYEVFVAWDSIEKRIQQDTDELGLNLEPDFQRAHVWTQKQQEAYVSYVLRGGEVGKNLTFNHPNWMGSWKGEYVIVDGKQRLEAVLAFKRNEFKVFGHYFKEFEDRMSFTTIGFNWRVCKLKTREELLQLYLNINAGGTPHTKAELKRVRKMLQDIKLEGS